MDISPKRMLGEVMRYEITGPAKNTPKPGERRRREEEDEGGGIVLGKIHEPQAVMVPGSRGS